LVVNFATSKNVIVKRTHISAFTNALGLLLMVEYAVRLLIFLYIGADIHDV
jgi:hypothetical protein